MKKQVLENSGINKEIILKNFLKYTPDKALLKVLLDKQKKETFTEEEVLELLKNENERVVN